MIKTEEQYQRAQKFAQKFKNKMDALEAKQDQMDNLEFEYDYNAAAYQYNKIQDDIDEYEGLINNDIDILYNQGVDEIGEILVKARLRQGLSIAVMAKTMDVNEDTLRKHHEELYENASIAYILNAVDALDLDLMFEIVQLS